MPNIVLDRLRTQRAEQLAAMDSILENVGDDRDLVDAERSLLNVTRDRIAELDAQIEPLAAYEAMHEQHRDTVPRLPRARRDAAPSPTPAEAARSTVRRRIPRRLSPRARYRTRADRSTRPPPPACTRRALSRIKRRRIRPAFSRRRSSARS